MPGGRAPGHVFAEVVMLIESPLYTREHLLHVWHIDFMSGACANIVVNGNRDAVRAGLGFTEQLSLTLLHRCTERVRDACPRATPDEISPKFQEGADTVELLAPPALALIMSTSVAFNWLIGH